MQPETSYLGLCDPVSPYLEEGILEITKPVSQGYKELPLTEYLEQYSTRGGWVSVCYVTYPCLWYNVMDYYLRQYNERYVLCSIMGTEIKAVSSDRPFPLQGGNTPMAKCS